MVCIYCDSVFDAKIVEPEYELEYEAAHSGGFETALISFESLVEGNIREALKLVQSYNNKVLGIYRGWMLTLDQYTSLYEGLQEKNILLINNPEEYAHCHYLPYSYDKIKSKTPTSRWTTGLGDRNIQSILEKFDENPLIIKDYVKSEKHHWETACYIPNASDWEHARSVIHNFIQLRGNALNEGIVFRKFEELEFLATHSKSGMPLTKEFRIFFFNKKIINVCYYWDDVSYEDKMPELHEFIEIAQEIKSNFFTMDIAKKKHGDWIVMELGDGQVAGLPDNVNRREFYKNLKEAIHKKNT